MTDSPNDMRAVLADRLKQARTLAGLSQGQVAKLLGMHRPSITEIELGNRRVSAEELSQFASLYDVSVAWLMAEVPDTLESSDPRLQLAARELTKLKPEDLDRLLKLLAVMRDDSPNPEEH